MIHSLKIKNFLSFRDEVEFSFEATNDDNLKESHVIEISPKVRLLKLGIIYGANASGKSNLIKVFEFLEDFLLNNPKNKDEKIEIFPFLLDKDSRNKPSEFILILYINKKKYVYTLHVNNSDVLLETLDFYPGQNKKNIFERKLKNNKTIIDFNKDLNITKVAKEEIEVKCLNNMSLFAAYNSVNIHNEEIDIIIKWIKEKFLGPITPRIKLETYTKMLIDKNNSIKDYVLNFLHEADFNISNINIDKKTENITDKILNIFLSSDLPEEEKDRLQKEKTITTSETKYSHKVINNNKEEIHELPEKLQSRGTIRTFGLSGVFNKINDNKGFLAVDEIESSLHPKLVEFIIETFLKESKESQLLLTTHYDGLLEERDLFRNDNIWFTNKKQDGSTELYSLSDFKGVNRISLLKKAYKYGKFGATPNI